VQHSRDEVRLEAPGPGRWEYRFTRIDDRFYQGVVDLPEGGASAQVYRHEVAEVGDAKWRNAKEGKTVHSCEGETVQVEIELQVRLSLTLPRLEILSLRLIIVAVTDPACVHSCRARRRGTSSTRSSGSRRRRSRASPSRPTRSRSKSPSISLSKAASSHSRSVRRPSLAEEQVLLAEADPLVLFPSLAESVRDAHGCKRPLTGSDLNVEVRRTKPTARFHGAEGVRTVTLRDDDTARIPLRLTGEGVRLPFSLTLPTTLSARRSMS